MKPGAAISTLNIPKPPWVVICTSSGELAPAWNHAGEAEKRSEIVDLATLWPRSCSPVRLAASQVTLDPHMSACSL